MKVLVVCSGTHEAFSLENHQAFIYDQMNAMMNKGIEYSTFFVKENSYRGYLKHYFLFKKELKKNSYDLIHAYYGLSGLLAVLQRECPVVVTFLGSDIHNWKIRILSKIAIALSTHSIFVSEKLAKKSKVKRKYSILPFGVNLNLFYELDKFKCKKKQNFDINKKYALFASSFNNPVKNFKLAKAAIDNFTDIELISLMKNLKREEINVLMNACDFLILTSFSEGSPQVIKEAMACNTPIISTDVGDVKELIINVKGCYIISYDIDDIIDKIKKVISFGQKTDGRKYIEKLDNEIISKKLLDLYNQILSN